MTLREYLTRTGTTQSAFAAEVQKTEATVSRWVNGVVRPRAAEMRKIEKLTSGLVPIVSWFES